MASSRTSNKTSDEQSVSNIADSVEFEYKMNSKENEDVRNIGLQVESSSADSERKMEIDSETHVTDDIKHWCLYGRRISATGINSDSTVSEPEMIENSILAEQTPLVRAEQTVAVCTGRCPTCNRNFDRQRLEAHINICEKLSGKKRCVFDSRQQRLKGTAGEYYTKTIERTMKEPAKLCSNWKQARKEFVQKVRTDRMSKIHSPPQFAFVSEDRPHP